METSEILDKLEKFLILRCKDAMKELKIEISEQQARNLLGKIGARIIFNPDIEKEELDKILLGK